MQDDTISINASSSFNSLQTLETLQPLLNINVTLSYFGTAILNSVLTNKRFIIIILYFEVSKMMFTFYNDFMKCLNELSAII